MVKGRRRGGQIKWWVGRDKTEVVGGVKKRLSQNERKRDREGEREKENCENGNKMKKNIIVEENGNIRQNEKETRKLGTKL